MTSPAVATPRADDSDAWWRSIRDIRRDDRAFVFILTILAGVIYWATNPARVELDGFVPLADALLHGKLYIGPEFGYLEHAPGPNGGGYMPYPPAPVLFVLPVVALFGPTVIRRSSHRRHDFDRMFGRSGGPDGASGAPKGQPLGSTTTVTSGARPP